MSALPLSHLRVLELSSYIAVPLVTKVLANFGAQVIKIENPARPDGLRLVAVPRPPDQVPTVNNHGTFNLFNDGKLALGLDLNDPRGPELVRELVKISDIVVDNFARDPMPRWGLDYDNLVRLKPDIIVLRSCTAGSFLNRASLTLFGWSIASVTGHNSIAGFPQDPPVGACLALPDYSANPFHALVALFAALRHRNRTGEGQYIELYQYQSTACFLGPAIMDYTVNGRVRGRNANRDAHAAPHGAYPCKGEDRWVAVAVTSDEEWQGLCRALGSPSWCQDRRFATLEERLRHQDELDGHLKAWTRRREAEEVFNILQENGVPAGVVQDTRDVLERDPQLRERGTFVKLRHTEIGEMSHMQPPYRLSEAPVRLDRPSPLMGEHNDFVLGELIGLPEEETNRLIVDGVVG